MANLLLRLEGSASFFGRIFLRSKNYFHGNNFGGHGYHRMMSSIKVSPRLMLPPTFEGGNLVYQFYNLADDRVESLNRKTRSKEEEDEERDGKIVSCSHGWVAFLSSRLFLSNPLTCRHIKLPPFYPLRDPDDGERHFKVSKIILSCSPDDDQGKCRAMMSFGFGSVINKLAFCLPGCSTHWTCLGKLKEVDDEDEYEYEDEDQDEKDKSKRAAYADTIYSARHKLFFSITKSNVLQVWDLQKDPPRNKSYRIGELKCGHELLEILKRSVVKVKPEVRRQKYLVLDNHSNQLFLVRRHIMTRVGPDGTFVFPFYFGYRRGQDDSYPYKTIGFDVHKIDLNIKRGKTKVTFMEGGGGGVLDGLAMFIGLNHSFALPVAEYPGLIPNSIYFTDKTICSTPLERAEWGDVEPPHPRWVDRIYGGHDIGIFNYENKTFSSCYYPCDVQSIKQITPPPFWFTSSPH